MDYKLEQAKAMLPELDGVSTFMGVQIEQFEKPELLKIIQFLGKELQGRQSPLFVQKQVVSLPKITREQAMDLAQSIADLSQGGSAGHVALALYETFGAHD
ncbi:MAG: hypothetical protein KKB59_14190 [Spirochaetes bacterium]|nr:hypothetical protein [Spirochaetota bacterium]